MSFLLRNNRRNKDSNPGGLHRPAFGADRRIIPEPRNPSMLRNKNNISQNTHTQATFDYGTQIQIQRQVQRPTSVSTKHATVTKQTQQQEGVITMNEVLEDLRVLEMQQRDSQRKLAQARITKDNRLQQQAALEVQLERNKYANGELRAQIRQFRDFLSCGTRELGTRRLAGSRAGDDIKAFEQKLKQGLQAQRTNTSLVRKISSLIIGLQNKEAILQRLNAESKEKFALLEKDSLDAKRREENLRKSIQNEVSKAHKIANEVAQIRSKSSALEEELLSAQSSEESTRLQVQALDAELESENKRHADAMNDLQAKLKSFEQDTLSCQVEQKEFLEEMEKLSKELLKKKEQVVAIQEKEGHAPSSFTDDFKEAVPVLNKKKFAAILETAQSNVSSKHSENEELRAKLDGIRATIEQNKQDAEKNRNETKSLMETATSEEATQKTRSKEIVSFQELLEKERSEVVELRKSAVDLEEEHSKESLQNSNRNAEIDGEIQKIQDVADSLSKQIAEIEEKEKTLEESWQAETSDIKCCLQTKKEAIQALELECARTEEEEIAGHEEFEKSHKESMKRIEEEGQARLERMRAKQNKLFEQYPSLKEVDYEYDGSRDLEDHAQEVLHDLTKELESKLDAAEQARKERDEEKRDAIRKAAEAEAAVRRKEELRKETREKRLAEVQRELEERSRNQTSTESKVEDNSDDEAFEPKHRSESSPHSSTEKRSSKKRKDSDFFDPEEKTVFSETEPSPAEPKLLFGNHDDEDDSISAHYSTTSGTQNSEKRVHWKDQNSGAHGSSDDETVKSQNKSHTSKSLRQTRKYGSSSEGKSTSTKSSSSRSSRSSDPIASRTTGNIEDFDDMLNSESIEDVPSKDSISTKTTTSHSASSSKSNSSSRTSSKADPYDDLLNSDSSDDESYLKRATKSSSSRTYASNKSSSTRTSSKSNADLPASECTGDESSSKRKRSTSTKDATSRNGDESFSIRKRSTSTKDATSRTYRLTKDRNKNSDRSGDYNLDETKKDKIGKSGDYLLDESSTKALEKKSYRRRSTSSKREQKSYFDSLIEVPDASSHHDHSDATKQRKSKKSSTESRYLDDLDAGVDERPKKKLREDRSSHHNETDADSSHWSKPKPRTKKYGTSTSKDEVSKKSTKDRKSDGDSRPKSSASYFGDEDSYSISRSKSKKDDNWEKSSSRHSSLDKHRSASSSSKPKDKDPVKSQSSKGSKGSSKSRLSSSSTVGKVSSDSRAKVSKEVSTSSLASSSRSQKVPTDSKKTEVSKKRKLSATTSSQVSDATSRSQKARRRKKSHPAPVSSKASSKALVSEGSYDFHF